MVAPATSVITRSGSTASPTRTVAAAGPASKNTPSAAATASRVDAGAVWACLAFRDSKSSSGWAKSGSYTCSFPAAPSNDWDNCKSNIIDIALSHNTPREWRCLTANRAASSSSRCICAALSSSRAAVCSRAALASSSAPYPARRAADASKAGPRNPEAPISAADAGACVARSDAAAAARRTAAAAAASSFASSAGAYITAPASCSARCPIAPPLTQNRRHPPDGWRCGTWWRRYAHAPAAAVRRARQRSATGVGGQPEARQSCGCSAGR